MSHYLVWKEHYKPKYNYLTLDFCVLTKIIIFVRFCLVRILFMNSRSSLLKSNAECPKINLSTSRSRLEPRNSCARAHC